MNKREWTRERESDLQAVSYFTEGQSKQWTQMNVKFDIIFKWDNLSLKFKMGKIGKPIFICNMYICVHALSPLIVWHWHSTNSDTTTTEIICYNETKQNKMFYHNKLIISFVVGFSHFTKERKLCDEVHEWALGMTRHPKNGQIDLNIDEYVQPQQTHQFEKLQFIFSLSKSAHFGS